MVQLFRQKSTLSIDLYQDTIFVHPPVVAGEPGHDELLRGTITLQLHAPTRMKRIKLLLKGTASILSDYQYATVTTLEKQIDISLDNEKLAAGSHVWNFTMIIPSTTATQERSTYGNVRHTLRAWCEGTSGWGSIEAFPRPVWLVASPCPAGELPTGLEVVVRHLDPACGPIALHISSPHLTVASLCFMNIAFDSPPALEVLSVGAYILQSFSVHYDDPSVGTIHPPRQKKVLFYVDQTSSLAKSTDDLLDSDHLSRGASLPATFESRARRPKPLITLEPGIPWSYSRIVRMLDDDSLRPTTLDGSETPIRVKHKLVMEVRYRVPGSKAEKTLECSTNVTIASCCCLSDSLLLPSYVKQQPKEQRVHPFHRRCLCNRSLQDLVSEDGARLCGADARHSTPQAPPPKLNAEQLRLARQWSARSSFSGLGRRISRDHPARR